jgi:hypothetical protein
MLTLVAKIVLAIAKGLPAANALWNSFATGWAAHLAEIERLKHHEQIDADREKITASPWACPARCPHRGMHQQNETKHHTFAPPAL